jgi:hypothetical protein
MRRLLTPRLADKITSFDESLRTTMRRLRTTGAMFDTVAWAKKVCPKGLVLLLYEV